MLRQDTSRFFLLIPIALGVSRKTRQALHACAYWCTLGPGKMRRKYDAARLEAGDDAEFT